MEYSVGCEIATSFGFDSSEVTSTWTLKNRITPPLCFPRLSSKIIFFLTITLCAEKEISERAKDEGILQEGLLIVVDLLKLTATKLQGYGKGKGNNHKLEKLQLFLQFPSWPKILLASPFIVQKRTIVEGILLEGVGSKPLNWSGLDLTPTGLGLRLRVSSMWKPPIPSSFYISLSYYSPVWSWDPRLNCIWSTKANFSCCQSFIIERHLRTELAQVCIWISYACFEIIPGFCPCLICNFPRFIWS